MPCFICLKNDNLDQCTKCQVFMCKRHREVHKSKAGLCFPYKVEFRDQLGRILVATRNIKKGEVICEEVPAIVGPYSRSSPQCLQCFKILHTGHKYTCSGCGYPMCGDECSSVNYHKEECMVFRQSGLKVEVTDMEYFDSQYSAISVLRLLLLMEREEMAQKTGSNIDNDYLLCLSKSLMDHNQERKDAQPEIWQFEEDFMVNFIHEKCRLKDRFTAEEIHGANGRIMMNATSLELPEDGYGRGAGLFPIYSMMNTSCRNNTKSNVLPDHSVEILAKVKIKAGEEITNQYHKPDKAAFIRRQIMREKWFFDCSCARCMDPSELGSHYSSLLCPKLRCGGSVMSLDTTCNTADWACEVCGELLNHAKVINIIETAEAVIDNYAPLDGPVEHFERVLYSLSESLHPGNFLLLDVKERLAMMYGNMMPYTLDKMRTPARERKIQLCHDVISSLSKVEAGLSTWHIAMLTELAKMADPHLSRENNDPGGKKGMMARFLFKDKVLTRATCLNLLE